MLGSFCISMLFAASSLHCAAARCRGLRLSSWRVVYVVPIGVLIPGGHTFGKQHGRNQNDCRTGEKRCDADWRNAGRTRRSHRGRFWNRGRRVLGRRWRLDRGFACPTLLKMPVGIKVRRRDVSHIAVQIQRLRIAELCIWNSSRLGRPVRVMNRPRPFE